MRLGVGNGANGGGGGGVIATTRWAATSEVFCAVQGGSEYTPINLAGVAVDRCLDAAADRRFVCAGKAQVSKRAGEAVAVLAA